MRLLSMFRLRFLISNSNGNIGLHIAMREILGTQNRDL